LGHTHALHRTTVWEQHPCEPGSHGIPADEWLLNMDAAGKVQPLPVKCMHMHAEMRHWPVDHLYCLDCKEVVPCA
jgi:hypothetical protein